MGNVRVPPHITLLLVSLCLFVQVFVSKSEFWFFNLPRKSNKTTTLQTWNVNDQQATAIITTQEKRKRKPPDLQCICYISAILFKDVSLLTNCRGKGIQNWEKNLHFFFRFGRIYEIIIRFALEYHAGFMLVPKQLVLKNK